MYSHSIITGVWMGFALLWKLTLGLNPWFFALFIIAWWWSREQYLKELDLRKVGQSAWFDAAGAIFDVWWPTQKNMDLIIPTAVAIVSATILSMF